VLVESAIFGGDERAAHVRRHGRQGDVDAPNRVQSPHRLPEAVEHPAALGGSIGANCPGAGTTVEAAREQPGIEEEEERDGCCEQRRQAPVPPHPGSRWIMRVRAKVSLHVSDALQEPDAKDEH
jgi:hypothetical protein